VWCCDALEPLGPEEEENAEIHEVVPVKRRTALDGDHSVKSHLSPSTLATVPPVATSEQIVSGAFHSFGCALSGVLHTNPHALCANSVIFCVSLLRLQSQSPME
jgi:hypothetical protein